MLRDNAAARPTLGVLPTTKRKAKKNSANVPAGYAADHECTRISMMKPSMISILPVDADH